tara:strand:+ start:110 stop:490 length:381 start_codon:yes stop_codon:yes gene_type:complete
MKQDENKKVVQLNNNRSITLESYETLAKRFKEIIRYADGMVWEIRHSFDEAFTKQEHSNSHSRKLKDFEVHERRATALNETSKLKAELHKELEALENGVLQYGIDIRDVEEDYDVLPRDEEETDES